MNKHPNWKKQVN